MDTPHQPPMDEQEMLDILIDLARNSGNSAARIAAIKELRAIGSQGKPVAAGFAALDAELDEVSKRRLRTKGP